MPIEAARGWTYPDPPPLRPPPARETRMALTRCQPPALAALVCLCGLPAACTQGGRSTDPVASYREGAYAQAYREAEATANASEGAEKDRAALMAGLAAYADRRPDAAERWLSPLTGNPNPEVAGTAGWTLGLIAADRGNDARAATLLPAAASKLKGDDAARAYLAAGDSFTRLRRTPEARAAYQAAQDAAGTDATRSDARARLTALASDRVPGGAPTAPSPPRPMAVAPSFTGPGYVVQLAAVSDTAKASALAETAAPAAARAGIPRPVVAPTTDPKTGRTLYGVQIGPFATREAATAGLQRSGLAGSVMAIRR